MRTHIFYISILFTLLLVMSIQHCQYVFKPAVNDMSAILVSMPNHTPSDQRKQKTLVDACASLAGLLQVGVITDTNETVSAFHIETANLRSDKNWCSIQQRMEMLLRKAKSVEEQEALLRQIADLG